MNERKETLSNSNDRGQRFDEYRSQFSDKERRERSEQNTVKVHSGKTSAEDSEGAVEGSEDVDAWSQLSSSWMHKRKVGRVRSAGST